MQMWGLLWSINETMQGREGLELPPPSRDWIDDLRQLQMREAAREQEQKRDKAEREAERLFES